MKNRKKRLKINGIGTIKETILTISRTLRLNRVNGFIKH